MSKKKLAMIALVLVGAAGCVGGPRPSDPGDDDRSHGDQDNGDTTLDTRACQEAIALPKAASVWLGDEHAAERGFFASDFAFDRDGNLVGVDRDGNLVRRTHDGGLSVWVPRVTKTARGVAFLSSGELVLADSGRGMLLKVYPNGEVRTLVAHLDYPNGLDVDLDDDIYVSEASRAAIVRVDPETGAVETIAMGLRVAPNGLAFSPDYRTLYVAGAGNGSVYSLTRDDNGAWGPAVKFAIVPGAEGPCDGKTENDTCEIHALSGACRDDGYGELYCRPTGPCDGREEGDACQQDGDSGTCQDDGAGGLYCQPTGPCDGKNAGDPCSDWGEDGFCGDDGAGGLYCWPTGPCDGKSAGDSCIVWGENGICREGTGGLYCRLIWPCDGKSAGDPCTAWGEDGFCEDDGGGGLYCRPVGPCDGMSAGDPCTDWGEHGFCEDDGGGGLYCQPVDPCDGRNAGDACETYGQTGICVDYGGWLTCEPPPPCAGLAIGDTCTTGWGDPDGICILDPWINDLYCSERPTCYGLIVGDACEDYDGTGICTDDLWGYVYCQPAGACSAASEGDACFTYYSDPGFCRLDNIGELYCAPTSACDDLTVGDPCISVYWHEEGECREGEYGQLWCRTREACDDKEAGSPCTTFWGEEGICVGSEPYLYCEEIMTPCLDAGPGDACFLMSGEEGICIGNGAGNLVCMRDACAGLEVDDPCEDDFGADGRCVENGDGFLRCRSDAPCVGKIVGAACVHVRSRVPGSCEAAAGGILVCQPMTPCQDKDEDDICTGRGGTSGVCADTGMGGLLWCDTHEVGGRLHGINTDVCGNVYVTDDDTDTIWRFSSDGQRAELVTSALQTPITGIAWGCGAAGWDTHTLYLAAGGTAEIIAVPLGIPGRPIITPRRTDTVPDGPPVDPETDCLNLPAAPILETELEGPVGFHDVAFSSDGFLVGSDGFNLVGVDGDGNAMLWASDLGAVEGMDWLPDNSLVAASDQGVVKVADTGATTVLAPDIVAYGVAVGPDGKVYAADNNRVYRVDPDNGAIAVYLDPKDFGESWLPRTVAFDQDYSLMYIGTWGDSVYVQTLDASLERVGLPRYFATVRAGVSWLDGLAVDACGNLYLPNFETSALFRISPDGRTSKYHQWDFNQYGHGIEFGNGVGKWRSDAIYLPQPYDENTVVELVIGVEAASWGQDQQ